MDFLICKFSTREKFHDVSATDEPKKAEKVPLFLIFLIPRPAFLLSTD